MKKLNLEQMVNVNGGKASTCGDYILYPGCEDWMPYPPITITILFPLPLPFPFPLS